MRWLLLLLLAALPASARPDEIGEGGRGGEAALFQRWREADADERRRLAWELERMERQRRYACARPVLVDFEGTRLTLAELFEGVLEPALVTPPLPEEEGDPAIQEIHRRALAALEALRKSYAPPHPVRPGTLNLLLGYAHRALDAYDLPAGLRLRLFHETVLNVRALDGRVGPDARTSFLVHERLLPALLGLARRIREDDPLRGTVSEAASLLFLPSLLDERAQAQLAPLTAEHHSRDVLVRFYRAGTLDDLGRVSLARSVAAQVRDDAAFAAGAAPLLLELLCDPVVAPRERGLLVDAVLERLVPVDVLRPAGENLLAAAFGGPPREAAAYRAEREHRKGGVGRPQGGRIFRFLSVVLLREGDGAPLSVARVLRADVRLHEPLHVPDGQGGRRFVGALVADAGGEHADFLGPPPGLTSARDNRLLRRRLRLERIAISTFGTRGEEVELCVTLPEDATEPVPATGADLADVVALVAARLRTTAEAEERQELVRLLVRVGTDAARALAVKYAERAGELETLLPLAERGDRAAARALLARLEDLDLAHREQALLAALAVDDPELRRQAADLCRHPSVAVAGPVADALLAAGDPAGVFALLGHRQRHARAIGASLALRLTPLAGSLRVLPPEPPDLEALAKLAGEAFTKEDGEAWVRLGRFARLALLDPDAVRERRRNHKPLYLGQRSVGGWEFADAWAQAVREGEGKELWPALAGFLLDPHDPGAGILDRHLLPLLDALEERARDGELRRAWVDGLVVLACAQYGMEKDAEFLELAHARLARAAGEGAPREARRRAGILWPVWAAEKGP